MQAWLLEGLARAQIRAPIGLFVTGGTELPGDALRRAILSEEPAHAGKLRLH